MFDLNCAFSFLKESKKNNFDNWFRLSYEEQKLFLETIVKDKRTIAFINNPHRYISNYSKTIQYTYIKRSWMLMSIISEIGIFNRLVYEQRIDTKYLNELLSTVNFILKKIPSNNPQP